MNPPNVSLTPPRTEQTPGVRRRVRSDLVDCVQVLAEVHHSDGYPVNWPTRPADWLEQGAQLAAWVAELDGRIVGHLALAEPGPDDLAAELWSRRAGTTVGDAAVITRLFVSPPARGLRIGALLMARAGEEAQRRDLHPVLDVVSTDTAAAALYERLGWRLLAVTDQQWRPGQTVTMRSYAAGVDEPRPGDPAAG